MDGAIAFRLPGEPRGWGRAGARIVDAPTGARFISHYTPAKTRKYEAALALVAKRAMASRPLFEGPLRLAVVAVFEVPKSWTKAQRTAALIGRVRPTGRPDADNILKMIDSFKGIIWRDDTQVVDARVAKWYGPPDVVGLEIEVAPWVPPETPPS